MNGTTHEPLKLSSLELSILGELLEAECAKLRVEIRRTDHRTYRDELRRRLDILDSLAERFRQG